MCGGKPASNRKIKSLLAVWTYAIAKRECFSQAKTILPYTKVFSSNLMVAGTLKERLLGLKAYKEFTGILMLVSCCDIHTFGMKEPIDVAFVSQEGLVLKAVKRLQPYCRIRCSKARYVLERYACDADWPQEGAKIALRWS